MRGWGKVVQGIVGHGKDLNAYPTEVGALEDCGERRRQDLIQMFIGNPCGFCGEDRLWGTRDGGVGGGHSDSDLPGGGCPGQPHCVLSYGCAASFTY